MEEDIAVLALKVLVLVVYAGVLGTTSTMLGFCPFFHKDGMALIVLPPAATDIDSGAVWFLLPEEVLEGCIQPPKHLLQLLFVAPV